ncbi:S8 family peptidase [Aurantimonas endophytica]|uniref:Subtilisin family serine protease n=1 Tax=Aurantimonas endophytica TaxID=1522175 RepID=A0A7W6HDB5_9HYPH|nr:S8 family serine peptidase [Aurantimonas endophytica]MBB4003119.1 subtilisin family serine protease [Aurantimonas endophytica]MCO6403991.1 S8 family serine peptidase [Aurantimonas endophytica]
MAEVHFGRKDEPATPLRQSNDFIAVRTHRPIVMRRPPVPGPLELALPDSGLAASFPEANVGIYRVPEGTAAAVADAKAQLREMPDVRFAGRVLVDEAGTPIAYTENLFIKFVDGMSEADCLAILDEHQVTVKHKVAYAPNAWFVSADGQGQKVFDIAAALLEREGVEYCHPEIVREGSSKAVYPQQWHLAEATIGETPVVAHANVAAALAVATGKGVTIAILDDGFDIDHPEFEGKIIAPRDAILGVDDPRPKDPKPLEPENHGTACAGVACASGVRGASGVAPDAKLMPIRVSMTLGTAAEAEAFQWAADNGADVISCSWGPPDGNWQKDNDPAHQTAWPIPASTRLAIDYAAKNGRNGLGCVIVFSAGNGNEDVGLDGYASYDKVIAVAACNDRGVRSGYSDHGDAIWCTFPSNDAPHNPTGRPAPLTTGIWTTDRIGSRRGYNSGHPLSGDAEGYFTNKFGGTSSSCPGVSGVVALMLSVEPNLTRDEVRSILARSCDRIDEENGEYDARGWSRFYGWGRINAKRAVDMAASWVGAAGRSAAE